MRVARPLPVLVSAFAAALAVGAIGWPAETRANPSPPVTRLKLPAAKNRVKGNIEKGRTIALDWAQASHVACFPGNHFDAFSGNHVIYRFDLPAGAVAKIAMKPQSPTDDLNLYAYGAGANDTMVPPNVMNTNCEASYATQLPGTKPNPGVEERAQRRLRRDDHAAVADAGLRQPLLQRGARSVAFGAPPNHFASGTIWLPGQCA